MPISKVCGSVCSLIFLSLSLSAFAQTSQKPLHASEVLALQAGNVLPASLVHEIGRRGLSFHPDESYRAQLKKAGANEAVLAALNQANVTAQAGVASPNKELLQQLSNASSLLRDKRYEDSIVALSAAVKGSFAGPEAGFVMGELLRCKEEFQQAAEIYTEVLRQNPDFPQVHTKLSLVLYKMGDSEEALREAKLALTQNPEDAEAHKNVGLALEDLRKFDAAASEYREALRIKPDYALVHFDLGLLLYHVHDFPKAISEYKAAIALNPKDPSSHTNLGLLYAEMGDEPSAIREQREAKRLDPNDPAIRQNLAAALMSVDPSAAALELQALAKLHPDFEPCHLCLGHALLSKGDSAGAQAEYHKAMALAPYDPAPHLGLGNIEEEKGNLDAALAEYRVAEGLAGNDGEAHRAAGRVLLAKKDAAGALTEARRAAELSPTDWKAHELCGQALEASGEPAKAIAEFKEAVSLDPKQPQVILELANTLEKHGDWVAALETFRTAKLTEMAARSGHAGGESFLITPAALKGYDEAQERFKAHLAVLNAQGKTGQAAELEAKARSMESAPKAQEKEQLVMADANRAFQEQRYEDAEKLYKQAVELSEKLPASNENLIEALERLAGAYGMRQKFNDAEVVLHREMTEIEKAFGPQSPG